LNGHTLERVDKEKDLGVVFEGNLRFKDHIKTKALKANSMFGIIRRSFQHLDIATFLPLYKGMVRSHLDFNASVYYPHHQEDIDRIEAVQRRATKQIPELKGLPYPERLKRLKLPTLAYRRRRSDMIELYKITSGVYEEELCTFVKLRSEQTERQGNRYHNRTIFPTHSQSNIRRNSFGNRNTTIWNTLPASVVNAPTIDAFKRRLDSHWKH